MSAQIIPINESVKFGDIIETVNARDLHTFLKSKSNFADWIKHRIDQYGFTENSDFVIASENYDANRGGHNRRDYYISLDMAKELSMVERNAQGKQARQYFIKCERQTKSLKTPAIPTNMIEALEFALEQQKQIASLGPKAEYFDQFLDASGLTGLQNGMRCVNAKPNKGIEALRAKGILFNQGNALIPKAYYLDQGYFKVQSTVRDGKTYKQTFFTNRGIEWVSNVLPDEVFLKGAA